MRFDTLIKDVNATRLSGDTGADIASIAYDSRAVGGGALFAALRGAGADGHAFIGDAIAGGAAGILAESVAPDDAAVAWAEVADSRAALSRVAATFHDHPSRKLKVVGVTGTNGKTTTSFLLDHLVERAWHRSGLIGTVRHQIAGEQIEATHTTPESSDLQELLARMVDAGCRAVVMEASSHGIQQHRLGDVAFDVVVFTNLTRDHLDYHGTMDAYFAAKRALFAQVAEAGDGKSATMVINGDDRFGRRLSRDFASFPRRIHFGVGAGCDFQARGIRSDFRGTTFELVIAGRALLVRTPLIGRFNVYNTLAALAAGRALGVNLREAVAGLAQAPQIPGRMESVSDARAFKVFVDYAHTPDALVNALKTLRELNPRRLICVFGCGGNRDVPKRALMGRAASDYADATVITSDNPRRENPEAIIADIVSGHNGAHFTVERDRRLAIERAIGMADAGDIVLVAGKGHESTQQFADHAVAFDDRVVARQILAGLKGKESE